MSFSGYLVKVRTYRIVQYNIQMNNLTLKNFYIVLILRETETVEPRIECSHLHVCRLKFFLNQNTKADA
jgi:hypothetical protein